MEQQKKQWHEKTNDTIHDDNNIKGFFGDYRFLSNFQPCPVFYDSFVYQSSEGAYQASKTLNVDTRSLFETMSASEAKKQGKKVILRPDWEIVKIPIMKNILTDKFTRNIGLGNLLVATGQKYLEETNWWNDTFWGVCKGIGENNLGKTLMKIRSELQK